MVSQLGVTILLASFVLVVVGTTAYYVREDLLHPFVLLTGILAYFVLLPAAYLLVTGEFRYGLSEPHTALLLAVGVFFGIYLIALWAFIRTPVPDWLVDQLPNQRHDTTLLALFGGIGFVAGLAMYAYYVFLNGGPVRLFTVQPRTAFQIVDETARWRILGLTGIFGGMTTVLVAFRSRVEQGWRHLSPRESSVLVTVVGVALLVAVSTRARMVIIIPFLTVLVYVFSAGLISRRTVVGGGALVFVAGVGFGIVEAVLLGTGNASLIGAVVHTSRLQVLMATVARVPAEYGYQYGATLLRATLLEWPGMPMRTGNFLEVVAVGTDYKHRTFSGMMPAEVWLNFGLLGNIAFAVLYGAGLKLTYSMRDAPNALVRGAFPFAFVGVLLLLPTNITWALKGLLLRYLLPLVAAVVAVWVLRDKTRIHRVIRDV